MIKAAELSQVSKFWESKKSAATIKPENKNDCRKAALTVLKTNSWRRKTNLIKKPIMAEAPLKDKNKDK